MSALSKESVQQQIFALYLEKRYADALAMLDREGGHFPEMAQRVYFWRMCFQSLLDRPDDALDTFQGALDEGLWFAEDELRIETDLASLRALPRFKELATISKTRQVAAQAKCGPALLTLLPPAQAKATQPYPLLVALHGNNSNAAKSEAFWRPAIECGWLVALPQSSQLSTQGLEAAYRWDNFGISIRETRAHDAGLRRAFDIDPQRTVVGGFSMGGRLAVWLALSQAIPARGLVAVGPYLAGGPPDQEAPLPYPLDAWLPEIDAAKGRGIRAFLIIGDKDEGCYADTVKLADMLKARGVPCELKVYRGMAHVFPPDFPQVLVEALGFVTKGS